MSIKKLTNSEYYGIKDQAGNDALKKMEELIDTVSDVENSLAAIAPTFNNETAYTSGQFVWYSGILYRFTQDHAAGAWTGTDVEASTVQLDNSLTQSGKAADAKVVGDAIAANAAQQNANIRALAEDSYVKVSVAPAATTNNYKLDGKGCSAADSNYVLKKYTGLTPGTEIFILSEYACQFQKTDANVPTSNNTKLIAVYPCWNGRITVPEEGEYLIIMAKSGDDNGVYDVSGTLDYVDERAAQLSEDISEKQPYPALNQSGKMTVCYPADGTYPKYAWNGKLAQTGSGDPSPENVRGFNTTVKFTVFGKNLVNPSLYTSSKGGLTWTVNADKSVSISGTCNADGTLNMTTRYLRKGVYRLSGIRGCGSVSIEVIDSNNKSMGILHSSEETTLIYVPQDDTCVIRFVHLTSATPIDGTAYPMLTAGTGRYEFETYSANEVTVTLPDYFGGGTVYSDGSILMTHYRAVLSANSNLGNPAMGNNNTYYFALTDYIGAALQPPTGDWSVKSDIMCNALKTVAYSALYNASTPYIIACPHNNKQLIIRMPVSEDADTNAKKQAEVKAFFGNMVTAGTPVTIIYKLETPRMITGSEFDVGVDSSYRPAVVTVSQGEMTVTGFSDPASVTPKHSPVMTFVDDDGKATGGSGGSYDAFAALKKLMKDGRTPISLAAITHYIGTTNYLTWQQIRQLRGLGASVHSHTDGHIRLNTSITQTDGVYQGQMVTLEEMDADFKQTQATLDEHNCDIKLMVYPHGDITSETEALVRDYFSGGVTITEGMNEVPINPYRLMRYNLPAAQASTPVTRTLADWKQLADFCAASGGWLIWMTHLYSNQFNESKLNEIIELCEYATKLGIKIMNLKDGFNYFNNLLCEGNLNSSEYLIVDRDGTVYEKTE